MDTNIYVKLALIQKKLFVPKAQDNDFGKYKYRSCEDILTKVKPLCEEINTVLLLDSKFEEIGGRVYAVATANLIDLETDSKISSTASARDEDVKKGMDGSQISGSALSYARKYALAGLFCIDNEKDSDATNNGEDEKPKAEKPKRQISEPQKASELLVDKNHIATIKAELERTGITETTLCKTMGIANIEQMTINTFTTAMEKFKKTPSIGG